MNPFALFETKTIDDIKLGIQVVKSLNLQKEFESYFERSFIEYKDIFNKVVLVLAKTENMQYELSLILNNNLDLSIDKRIISIIILACPEVIDYFNLDSLESISIFRVIYLYPYLIKKIDLTKLDKDDIKDLIKKHPQLKPHFK